MTHNLTQEKIKVSKIVHKTHRNYNRELAEEIYNKNRGINGYERRSYSQLAIEYHLTATRIGQIVTGYYKKFILPTINYFTKDGVSLRPSKRS